MPTIAIVGASQDRTKFGNKGVRAYIQQGYKVYPVNPKADVIEGLKVYKTISEIPEKRLDRVSMYLPPPLGLKMIEEIAKKGTNELWLNPGAESDELIAKAESLGLNVIVACSIVDVGLTPDEV